MINFKKYSLENGLRLVLHQDCSSPIVAVNVLYDVGARDEHPAKTGFAHLFEHLMFGGSINIPHFDTPLQKVGGENNAFTNNDYTNYYITLPKNNLETALWLESDRMLSLAFSPKSLSIQKNVVIEEFKQSYLNQPYGDVWLLLRPLVYKTHPYQWPTIGKKISHIEKANLDDVKEFYDKYYNPNNAILVIAGDIQFEKVYAMVNKWFAEIPSGKKPLRNLPKENPQHSPRTMSVKRNVPANAIYKAYHMCSRLDQSYYTANLISDILSNGNSSRLYQKLVKEQKLFTEIHAFISGDIDEGMIIISGKLMKNVEMEKAEDAINKEIDKLKKKMINEDELKKVINKIEFSLTFSEVEILSKAMNLAYFELLGDAHKINNEIEQYKSIGIEQIQNVSQQIFRKENESTLYYQSE